jgi:hypothetical protein
MPSRMIRDALLNSDRFLGLPDNTARICYVSCLLTADDRGNLEASSGALVRLWRDFGPNSNAKAEDTAQFLSDKDLVRLYEVDGKRYMHIPRFGQRMRSFKRACPASPWCESVEESTKSPAICQQVAASSGKSRPEVKRSEEKYTSAQTAFARFWDAYPKRVSKGRALKAWSKLNPNELLTSEILQAVMRAKTSERWRKDAGQYVPHPATWLNDRGWEDEDALVTVDPTRGAV